MKRCLVASIGLLACGPAAVHPRAPVEHGTSARAVRSPEVARYQVPSCPLRYEASTTERMEMDMEGAAPKESTKAPNSRPSQLETFMIVDVTPRNHGMELRAAVTALLKMGTHRPFSVPDKTLAPVLLETDGARWKELQGPTRLFDWIGTQGGLAWFFPDLPSSDAVGAVVDWVIERPDQGLVLATEAARGTNRQLADYIRDHPATAPSRGPVTSQVTLTVRLDRWTDLEGIRVAELSMTGVEQVDQPMPTFPGMPEQPKDGMKGSIHYTGSYAVLSTGRLLSAEILRVGELSMHTGDKALAYHMNTRQRMHLVQACDGPVAAPLATPPSREERAVAAWGEAMVALNQSERDKVLAVFDSPLRAARGDAAIWKALTDYRDLRGVQALPVPTWIRDEDVRFDGERILMRISASTRDPSTTNTQTSIAAEIALREVEGRVVVTSVRAILDPGPGTLLEITPARVAVGRGWPPK